MITIEKEEVLKIITIAAHLLNQKNKKDGLKEISNLLKKRLNVDLILIAQEINQTLKTKDEEIKLTKLFPQEWQEKFKRHKIIWTEKEKKILNKLKMSNLTLIPIMRKGEWRGLIILGQAAPAPKWSPEIFRLLSIISNILGNILYI